MCIQNDPVGADVEEGTVDGNDDDEVVGVKLDDGGRDSDGLGVGVKVYGREKEVTSLVPQLNVVSPDSDIPDAVQGSSVRSTSITTPFDVVRA